VSAPRILVIGGTGIFGSRLVRGLVTGSTFGVIIAARDGVRAEAAAASLRAAHPGRDATALSLDARQLTPDALRATGAFALADAAGPWQGASYDLPRAAIAAGMHYVDLSDAREHVAGFAAALDAPARVAGVTALAGASSTPALSNAVLDELVGDWRCIEAIEVAISPGNRAPRGPSVVRAILSYAGQPVKVFASGAWRSQPGWGMPVRRTIPGVGRRHLSLCETPDLDILPARFAPRRDAIFRAGLELPALHFGLAAASWLVRAGLLRSLAPFAATAQALAGLLLPFGTDRGGMLVEARGIDADSRRIRACWSLVAEEGDGPMVPTLPALAALRALSEGRLPPGAYPFAGMLPLAALEAELAPYRIRTTIAVEHTPSLFEAALGDAFRRLPVPLQRLHRPGWRLVSRGEAVVDGPEGRLARLVGKLIGFPLGIERVPVAVEMVATEKGEHWIRDFGGRRFTSHLSPSRPGFLRERFGPLSFDLRVPCDASGLRMEVVGWRLLGLAMPRFLAPVSDAAESMDEDGRFRFDVAIGLPLGFGRIVRYRGWLVAKPN